MLSAGEVGWVVPPDARHRVFNDGDERAVSVPVSGTDTGPQKRHVMDLSTGDVRDVVSGYERP
jgi:hypothetical protein